MAVQITKRYLASIAPPTTRKEVFHWDANLAGFGVRVQSTGNSAYILTYRVGRGRGAPTKRITLGSTAKLTLDDARTQAKRLLGQVANGTDPKAKAPRVADTLSLLSVAETYLAHACGMRRGKDGKPTFSGRLRSADQRAAVFERLVYPHAIAKRHIGEIGRGDIVRFLDHVERTRGPRMAHVTLLSALFNWYAARHDTFRSPIVRGMSPIKPHERAGKRVLDDREIRDLWNALDAPAVSPCFARIVRALLFSALRRNEAARVEWREHDLQRRDGFMGDVLTVPADRMKGKLDHAVPLTPRLRALMGDRPSDTKRRPFVFSISGGKRAFRSFAQAKASLDIEINRARQADGREPMPRWVLHDLRRTAKTLMQRACVRPDISERVLAHSIRGVEGVYDRYGYLPEKMDALTKLDALVAEILKTIDW
jgi:integrase